jgi:hypothetical protein
MFYILWYVVSMFSPMIIICSLMSGECQTLPATAFETGEQCSSAALAHIETLTLPPQLVIMGWACFEWSQPA